MTSLSSGDVTLMICWSCTCTVSVQPTPQYGQIVSVTVCVPARHCPACAEIELRLRHQRAGRADRDAVAAIDARRIRQRHVELGRDVRVEAAAGDGDRKRVLRISAARLDALVAEHALRCSRERRGRCRPSPAARRSRPSPKRSGIGAVLAHHRACSVGGGRQIDGRRQQFEHHLARQFDARRVACAPSCPLSTFREQAGASTRAPSTSTTQTRHAFTGVSVSR